jgi:hypothetical protein
MYLWNVARAKAAETEDNKVPEQQKKGEKENAKLSNVRDCPNIPP